MLAFVLSEPEVVVGDHDREVQEGAFLGDDPALEVAK